MLDDYSAPWEKWQERKESQVGSKVHWLGHEDLFQDIGRVGLGSLGKTQNASVQVVAVYLAERDQNQQQGQTADAPGSLEARPGRAPLAHREPVLSVADSARRRATSCVTMWLRKES